MTKPIDRHTSEGLTPTLSSTTSRANPSSSATRNIETLSGEAKPAGKRPTETQIQDLQTRLEAISPSGWQLAGAAIAGLGLGILSTIGTVLTAVTGIVVTAGVGSVVGATWKPNVSLGAAAAGQTGLGQLVGGFLGGATVGAIAGFFVGAYEGSCSFFGGTAQICKSITSTDEAKMQLVKEFAKTTNLDVATLLDEYLPTADKTADDLKKKIKLLKFKAECYGTAEDRANIIDQLTTLQQSTDDTTTETKAKKHKKKSPEPSGIKQVLILTNYREKQLTSKFKALKKITAEVNALINPKSSAVRQATLAIKQAVVAAAPSGRNLRSKE